MDSQIFTTKNSTETRDLGKKIAAFLEGGEVLCLYGNLGAGKTTFTQGLAAGLGIKHNITSPTFILMRSHLLQNEKTFYHLDCYRLEKTQDAVSLGLNELFSDSNNIICIEWAERIKALLPQKRTDIYFKNIGEDKRVIKIKPCHCEE